jgi:acetyl-CoA C-acetyltransferase
MSGYSTTIGRRVAVLSSAQTALRTSWDGQQHIDLIGDVVSRCLEGVGLTLDDVDFVMDSGSDVLDGRSISNCGFLGALGAHHKEESRIEEDGLWAALYGTLKIQAAGADVGLIVAYSKASEADLPAFYNTQTEPFYQRAIGIDQTTACGLQASQYLAQTGKGEEVLSHVAAHDWANAANNPVLELGDAPPSADEIAGSALVASPLRELTISRPVDGAVAVLLATEQIASAMTRDPVLVSGVGAAMDEHMLAHRASGRFEACEAAARQAYRSAGMGQTPEVSLAEISGSSAAAELMVVQALGLSAGAPEDLFSAGAEIPINLSGGALPGDPVMATGLFRLSEAAQRLAGRVPGGAPEHASAAIVHGAGGLGMQNHCVFVLRR